MSEEAKTIFTGERFVPGIDDSELQIEHFQRYESILDIVKDKVVVDAACGEGYGTSIIGTVAKQVIGIDIEPDAIERATKKYATKNVSYQVGDISNLTLRDNSVDVFVSFETIEHVPEDIQIAFIPQVKKVLKDDGIFIISTPNKAIYSDLFEYDNEYHIHEFYKQEFIDLLKSQFSNVKIFHQYSEVAVVLDSNDCYAEKAIYHKNRNSYTSDGKYFIAVASNVEIDDVLMQSVYLQHDVVYRKQIQRILQLQNEVEERNVHLKKLDTEIAEKNEYIDHLNKGVSEKNEYINHLQFEVDKKDNCIKQLQLDVESANDKRQIFEYELEKHKKMIFNKDVHIRNLEAMIHEKDVHINNITPGYQSWMKLQNHPVVRGLKLGKKVVRRAKRKYKDLTQYKKLCFKKEANPKVSIIIPVYNQFDYTYKCLESVFAYSKDVSYEVIIGDDVSNDKTKHLERYAKNIKVIHNSENLKFLLNCNNAAKQARGEYILFLNNDTQVLEGWLSSLVSLIESDEKIGMVGSKLIYPNGTLQEAGGIIWKDASGWNFGRNDDPTKPEYNYVREVDYISGAAIMIRHSLWNEIGGFDELFVPAYCEDSDLAFQVREKGYKVMLQPKSVVVHFEGVSNGTDLTAGLKKYQVENSEKFYKKWKTVLEKQCEPGLEVFKAKDRIQVGKKVVLFIDHYVPTYDMDAGSKTTYQYIKMLIKKGYLIKFIGDNYAQMEPYTTALQQLGVEVLYGPWYHEHIFEWIEANKDYIDIAYLNRPHITEKYLTFLKEKTNIKCIYYGHDLHFLRQMREAELTGDVTLKQESEIWRKREFEIMRNVDMTYYPSQVEINAIHEVDATISAKAITAYVFEDFTEKVYSPDEREGLLFVGGFSHGPNIDAVKWFVNDIYPIIANKRKIPFYIVGSNAPDEIKNIDMEGVVFKGFVTDEELEALYKKTKVVVVPLRYGAGVKGKVVEALYNGLPIITTSVGAEGILGIEEIVGVQDSEEGMANAILDVYDDNERLVRMSASSKEYIKEHFSLDAAWEVIKEDFK